jgi:hypothetical protein
VGEVKPYRDGLTNRKERTQKEMKKVSKKLQRLLSAEFSLHQVHCSAYDAYNALDRVRGIKKIVDRAFALYAEAEEFHALLSRKIKEIQDK